MYTDDLKLYLQARAAHDDSAVFQASLCHLVTWSETWQLKISYKNCYMMRIGSVQHSSDFHLANNPLPELKAVKYHGVLIDQQLKFDWHINHIVVRASARSNLIHNCFVCKDTGLLVRAFITFV